MIERPYLNDFCEKCKNHYLITTDESRCRKIKLGQSDVMCVQVVSCDYFDNKEGVLMVVKNKFTDKTYEAIQYSYESFQRCKDFIKENMDISVTCIMPKMMAYGLKNHNSITEISPTDFIIRTITEGNPLYNVVSKDIMESNFEIIKQ